MAQELDFTDPEHMAGSTMAAFALAQLSFSTLVMNEIVPKAEAEKMLKQLIKANEGGSILMSLKPTGHFHRVCDGCGNPHPHFRGDRPDRISRHLVQ
jgi:hypothetical protein